MRLFNISLCACVCAHALENAIVTYVYVITFLRECVLLSAISTEYGLLIYDRMRSSLENVIVNTCENAFFSRECDS